MQQRIQGHALLQHTHEPSDTCNLSLQPAEGGAKGKERWGGKKSGGEEKLLLSPALPANKKHNFKHVSDDG